MPAPKATGPVSDAAHGFTLESLDGTGVSLADFRGQVVILDFWATWCGECRKLIPILGAIEKQYASRDVTVIGINERESQSNVEEFAKQNSFKAEILLDADGSVAAKYEVTGLPTLVILDTEGNVRKTISGFYPDMQKRIEGAIKPLLDAGQRK